ncbi:MAG: thiol:disulfide interchange protein DsbA/DsbL [Rhodocyclaceae bacterium]|jgi:thiol:disulfide interchange protein DsbA|nr:thiol:disulfide interchange protein DsbA/DsbL [Rhodocyclaceae bacterium]
MQRRLVLKQMAALGGLALVGSRALAQGAPYTVLPTPQPTEAKGKVEVIEFFSYGCPHCHDFDPLLTGWVKNLPKDVNFLRVPITFNRPEWAAYGRIYYALEAMGELDRLHPEVFKALHESHIPIHEEAALLDWAASKGVDRKKLAETLRSYGVLQARMPRALQVAAAYKVTGVPLLAVDGKWMISASGAKGFDNMLKVADELILKARKEQGRS